MGITRARFQVLEVWRDSLHIHTAVEERNITNQVSAFDSVGVPQKCSSLGCRM